MTLRQREPREVDEAFLAHVRTLPCTICRRPGCDAAHIRAAAPQYGKRYTGKGEKPSDKWAVPLCRDHHREQHGKNELSFWLRYGIADPFALAIALYASRPGAGLPKREPKRRIIKTPVRKPKGERRSIPKGSKLTTTSRLPTKGQVKFPRKRHEGF
jgi:hypothetical protein